MSGHCRSRSGVSLVELVVAMTILAAVLSSLAAVTLESAQLAVRAAGEGYRQGVVMQAVNRVTAEPFATLPSLAGCRGSTGGVFPHTICVDVTAPAATSRRVRIVVTPAQPHVPADTVLIDRTGAPALNPLNF